jgi:hypothetical protein
VVLVVVVLRLVLFLIFLVMMLLLNPLPSGEAGAMWRHPLAISIPSQVGIVLIKPRPNLASHDRLVQFSSVASCNLCDFPNHNSVGFAPIFY